MSVSSRLRKLETASKAAEPISYKMVWPTHKYILRDGTQLIPFDEWEALPDNEKREADYDSIIFGHEPGDNPDAIQLTWGDNEPL